VNPTFLSVCWPLPKRRSIWTLKSSIILHNFHLELTFLFCNSLSHASTVSDLELKWKTTKLDDDYCTRFTDILYHTQVCFILEMKATSFLCSISINPVALLIFFFFYYFTDYTQNWPFYKPHRKILRVLLFSLQYALLFIFNLTFWIFWLVSDSDRYVTALSAKIFSLFSWIAG
jgi:hypothetical protein